MIWRRFVFIVCVLTLASCSQFKTSTIEQSLGINESRHQERPIVLLISIDGFRHDYNQLYSPPFLSQLEKSGSTTQGFRPVYPTNTFPNHYSIVTGLYPDNHGIIANSFFDPTLERSYSLRDRDAVADGVFYGGIPLWSLARQQGMVSATFFWPGSEAEIAGVRPHYWRAYNHSAPHQERVDTVIEWLKLPAKHRPHFITLYFSDVDSAGHAHGPESKQVAEAIALVDETMKGLFQRIDALNLPVISIVTSDHGMAALSFERVEYLNDTHKSKEEKAAYSHFRNHGQGPFIFHYYQGPAEEKEKHISTLLQAHKRGKNFKTYRRGSLPKHLNFNTNERMGDLVTIASPGFTVGDRQGLRVIAGGHGFDPTKTQDMDGIFWIRGPRIQSGMILPVFENVHLYPLIAKLLGLEITQPIDGKLETLSPLLE
jgi:predicted AlkP superfamily pyrophosphatase or phosphodiesterase